MNNNDFPFCLRYSFFGILWACRALCGVIGFLKCLFSFNSIWQSIFVSFETKFCFLFGNFVLLNIILLTQPCSPPWGKVELNWISVSDWIDPGHGQFLLGKKNTNSEHLGSYLYTGIILENFCYIHFCLLNK